MGCYGIGINRILAAAIELGHDDNGCILPIGIAPFAVEVLILNNDNPRVVAEAERIYDELATAGVDVLLDDRDVRAGVKFKDADLIGIPLRVVVGERGLKEGSVEVKRRTEAKAAAVPAADAVAEALRIVTELNEQLDNPG
jgi:prolyl-tRNA synthetase